MLIKHSVRFRVNGRGLIISNKSKGETMMRVEKKEEKAEKTKTKQIKRETRRDEKLPIQTTFKSY